MGRRKIVLVFILMMLFSLSLTARRLTTTQMRDNTIRINAMELDEHDITKVRGPKEVTVVLDSRSLNFDFDKSNVKPEYYTMLENLKSYMEYNDYEVSIIGHTDYMGTDAYNIALGQRRAESVKRKLIEMGLSSDRIVSTSSRGEREPVSTNETAEGRAENRRIEFQLVRRD